MNPPTPSSSHESAPAVEIDLSDEAGEAVVPAPAVRDFPDVPLSKAYRRVFDELAGSGYRTWNVHGFYVENGGTPDPDRVNVVLRIDVDSGLHLEPALARALAHRGIAASHFFLTRPERYYAIWGSDVPRAVAHEERQEVGLHTDHYFEELTMERPALPAIREDVAKLAAEAGVPIRGMVYHGHRGMNELKLNNNGAYFDVPAAELGLAYHDGREGPYTRLDRKGKWQPPADLRFSDYFGIPDSFGWVYWPARPVKVLRSMKPGEILHLSFHTANAFEYWNGWTTEFGEEPIARETTSTVLRKAWRVRKREWTRSNRRWRRRTWRSICDFPMTALAWFLAKVVGLFCRGWRRDDPYTDWDYHNQTLWEIAPDTWRERLRDIGVEWEGRDVLEIGPGPGQWLAAMSTTAKSLVGVEPNPAMHDWAQRKYAEHGIEGIRYHTGKGEALPIDDASQDVVLCLGVLQFTNQVKAIREIARVLRPGCRAYVYCSALGYFVMRLKTGMGNRHLVRTRQGLRGLWRGIVVRDGKAARLPKQKPTTVKRMQWLADASGLDLVDTRVWQDRTDYDADYAGFPTSYLFVLEKRR